MSTLVDVPKCEIINIKISGCAIVPKMPNHQNQLYNMYRMVGREGGGGDRGYSDKIGKITSLYVEQQTAHFAIAFVCL